MENALYMRNLQTLPTGAQLNSPHTLTFNVQCRKRRMRPVLGTAHPLCSSEPRCTLNSEHSNTLWYVTRVHYILEYYRILRSFSHIILLNPKKEGCEPACRRCRSSISMALSVSQPRALRGKIRVRGLDI